MLIKVGYERRFTYPSAYLSQTSTFLSEFLTGTEKAAADGRLIFPVHASLQSAKSSEGHQVKFMCIHRISIH